MYFRPYTLENLEDLAYYKNKYSGYIEMENKGSFTNWLTERESVIFCFSTSIVESIISKVPYITVQGIIEERLEYHLPKKEIPDVRGKLHEFVHRPKTVRDMVELALKAEGGNLGIKVDPENSPELKRYLTNYFGYPGEKLASLSIAENIDLLLSGKEKNKSDYLKKGSIKDMIEAFLGTIALMRKKSQRKYLDDYHLMPWDLSELKFAESYYKLFREGKGV